MRNLYGWVFSGKLISKAARFEDQDDIHRVLEASSARPRSVMVICAFALWILLIAYVSRTLLSPLLSLSAGVTQAVIQPIVMLAGFYWLFNYGLRKPFQCALREALQSKGVPICLGCGYDLRGQTATRCSECNRTFPAELLQPERELDVSWSDRRCNFER